MPPGNINYGVEGATPGTCTGGTPAANYSAAGATNNATGVEGALPTATLGLSSDFMYDGWGNRFRYAVDASMTANGAFQIIPLNCNMGPITVNDGNGNARSTAATYALISHGPDGHGAYTKNGVTTSSGSSSADQLTNCRCTSAGVYNPTYVPTYVQKDPVYDTGQTNNPLYYFDDIVTYKERWQIVTPNDKTASSCPFIYVADAQNARVVKTDLNGTYIGQFGCSGTGACTYSDGNGQFLAFDIAADSSGNLWVSDQFAARVEKIDSNGNWLMQFGSCSTGWCGASSTLGSLNQPTYLTIDSGGNIWVTDSVNYRVEKFSASGTFLLAIGEGYNGVAGTVATAGTAAGQFKTPGSVAIDKNGNIYVVDSTNNNVQIFNSSGAYTGQLGGCGAGACTGSSANGKYYQPTSITIDPNGNFWIGETFNSRVQKLNSAGVWQLSIGGSFSNANGQFEVPADLAFDSAGNLWVSDSQNLRLQKFNSTTGAWIATYSSSKTTGSVAFGQLNGLTTSSR